mmetsp:Transcript_19787/g.50226  ORF Transcript_19787/g.50226 Transcript_19787/m.50226 type:complete len:214 (-) Transcript_19787:531-1172(-)
MQKGGHGNQYIPQAALTRVTHWRTTRARTDKSNHRLLVFERSPPILTPAISHLPQRQGPPDSCTSLTASHTPPNVLTAGHDPHPNPPGPRCTEPWPLAAAAAACLHARSCPAQRVCPACSHHVVPGGLPAQRARELVRLRQPAAASLAAHRHQHGRGVAHKAEQLVARHVHDAHLLAAPRALPVQRVRKCLCVLPAQEGHHPILHLAQVQALG